MKEMSNYAIEDVKKLLQINKDAQNTEQSKSLKKLLSVQDKIFIFKNIDQKELKSIVYNLKFEKFNHKEYIVKQNDIRDEIFFIIDGECQVVHDNEQVGLLRAGEIFGEAGAIFRSKRNASVICESNRATLLSFCIDENNMEFCASALATLYKNLAFEINAKLSHINKAYTKK